MKKTKYLVLYLALILLNTVCILTLAENKSFAENSKSENTLSFDCVSVGCIPITEPEKNLYETFSDIVRLYFPDENTVENIPIEEYLVGVLVGEMSVGAPIESLKAMAVAARTYTLYMTEQNRDKDWDVAADSYVCQAYTIEYDGKDLENIKKAIADTCGQIITYDSKPICALYHASSVYKTENSENVFIEKLPYLTSVDSFETKDTAYYSEKTFTSSEITDLLSSNNLPSLSPESLSFKVVENENGRCKALSVSDNDTGIIIDGREARELFKIKSTNFTIEKTAEGFVFRVYGFGHGVGLSQNGAIIMSENGYNYRQILERFYTDTDISKTIYKS